MLKNAPPVFESLQRRLGLTRIRITGSGHQLRMTFDEMSRIAPFCVWELQSVEA